MNDHQLRREYALDKAQAEGRIVQASRPHWSAEYDRDPAGTEQNLARFAAVPLGILGYSVDQTRAAGLTLMRGGVLAGAETATVSPASTGFSDETVTAWTQQLFPETRVDASPRRGRVTRDTKG